MKTKYVLWCLIILFILLTASMVILIRNRYKWQIFRYNNEPDVYKDYPISPVEKEYTFHSEEMKTWKPYQLSCPDHMSGIASFTFYIPEDAEYGRMDPVIPNTQKPFKLSSKSFSMGLNWPSEDYEPYTGINGKVDFSVSFVKAYLKEYYSYTLNEEALDFLEETQEELLEKTDEELLLLSLGVFPEGHVFDKKETVLKKASLFYINRHNHFVLKSFVIQINNNHLYILVRESDKTWPCDWYYFNEEGTLLFNGFLFCHKDYYTLEDLIMPLEMMFGYEYLNDHQGATNDN